MRSGHTPRISGACDSCSRHPRRCSASSTSRKCSRRCWLSPGGRSPPTRTRSGSTMRTAGSGASAHAGPFRRVRHGSEAAIRGNTATVSLRRADRRRRHPRDRVADGRAPQRPRRRGHALDDGGAAALRPPGRRDSRPLLPRAADLQRGGEEHRIASRQPRRGRDRNRRALQAQRRLADDQRFVAEASELLASSLDYETTLANLATLAVPTSQTGARSTWSPRTGRSNG